MSNLFRTFAAEIVSLLYIVSVQFRLVITPKRDLCRFGEVANTDIKAFIERCSRLSKTSQLFIFVVVAVTMNVLEICIYILLCAYA